jgi:hypothetical protein
MVAVKMGGMMPPMGGMPQPMNMMPPPMPVPPMGQQMMPPQPMPMQQGAAPVAPQARSNAGRRKRFGDSLESMLSSGRQPVASDQMAGMNVFTGQMPRRPMPRGQMMGGTAMQPPVRRMMGGGPVSVPRETDIYGQPHMLAYINPEEADLLQGLGGMGTPGPGGVPQYNWFTDFISDVFSGGSSNTGGRNEPRGSSSSSSQSYTQPSNDPYAENRPSGTSTSSADAGKQYAESMIAGGGGTNLSGSGSSAMADLVAAQQAQTQKDDGPSQSQDAMDFINQQFYKQQEEQKKNDEIRAANEAQAAAEAEMNLDIFGGAGPDVTPTINTGVIGGYDTLGIGSSDDPLYTPPSSITINDTPPSDITGSFSSPGDLNFLDPSVLYYDIDGVPHNTSAEQQAANRLINERKAREQEAQAAADEAAMIQAEAARAQAERERIAQQAAAESNMGLGPFGGTGGPDDSSYVSDVFETPPNYEQAQAEAEMGLDPFGGIGDPIKEGLGKDISLDKAVTDAAEETDDRNFIQKLVDDIKGVPGGIANDIQMALAAGLFGSRETRFDKLIKAGYTKDQANKFLDASEKTMKDMMDKQAQQSAQDDDGGSKNIVDPCPEGMRLDPVAGICVPIEEEDDTEDDTDEEEDTSDDELSGVVTTPPPPTSYLDNPIRMNRGGSVGLNRAADNFLAAMGG